MTEDLAWDLIVIGASAGGMEAINSILSALPSYFPIPIVVSQHLAPSSEEYLVSYLNERTQLVVKEAENEDYIRPGYAYIAPGGYHILIENNHRIALCVSEKVSYARPSIDVMFRAACEVYGSRLLGIVLTGANTDGTAGARNIKQYGGQVIAQDPSTAEASCMPQSVISAKLADQVLSLEDIGSYLNQKIGR